MAQEDDNEIVGAYLSGDLASFGVIIERHLGSVYNFVSRLSGDKDEANDITQEIFIKVWKNLKKFDTNKNFKTWILAIARNTVIDWFRKKKSISFSQLNPPDRNEISFEETLVDVEPLPNEIFARKELTRELETALSKIRLDWREIIFLHYTEGLTFEEIGEVVGKPPNTVKSHHLRALHQIRNLLRI
ncbi:MAG: RNA polymerase sigma factor [Candidatus Zambryskibacteria bacterium]